MYYNKTMMCFEGAFTCSKGVQALGSVKHPDTMTVFNGAIAYELIQIN